MTGCSAIAVDSRKRYVAGTTSDRTFPVTPGAAQLHSRRQLLWYAERVRWRLANNGNFISKISPDEHPCASTLLADQWLGGGDVLADFALDALEMFRDWKHQFGDFRLPIPSPARTSAFLRASLRPASSLRYSS